MCDLIYHIEEGETIVLKEGECLLAVWNNNLTINFYKKHPYSGEWQNVDCCTMGNLDPHSDKHDWYDARSHAREYLEGLE